jgi:hypothetical protein
MHGSIHGIIGVAFGVINDGLAIWSLRKSAVNLLDVHISHGKVEKLLYIGMHSWPIVSAFL